MKHYEGFSSWLYKHLANDMPATVIAISFNLIKRLEQEIEHCTL